MVVDKLGNAQRELTEGVRHDLHLGNNRQKNRQEVIKCVIFLMHLFELTERVRHDVHLGKCRQKNRKEYIKCVKFQMRLV